MVLSSFFKKAEKMPERVAVRPDGSFVPPPEQVREEAKNAPAPATEIQQDDDFSVVSTFYSGGSYGVEIDEGADALTEIAELAAMSYANGQISVARTTLESMVRGNNDPGAIRLWNMLFDLLRIQGDRPAFDALGLEFANVCELSPPSWNTGVEKRQQQGESPQDEADASRVMLQGTLVGDDPLFNGLLLAMSKGEARALDFGRLVGLDGEAAAKLAKVLTQVRRRGIPWELVGATGLAKRLGNRTIAGQRQDEPLWLLVLELYQFLNMEAEFEEKALNYAITFEVSPPSWEPFRPKAAKPAKPVAKPAEKKPATAVISLEGEICQGDQGAPHPAIQNVKASLQPGKECRLDFSGVTRIDFGSAANLLGIISSASGSQIVIHHPNRLVAELLRMAGVDKAARIVLARN
jgi:ABC-type transporter Mla MlaB component